MANIKYIIFIAAFLSIAIFGFSIYSYAKADETGKKAGEDAGILAGNTIGSFNGITNGLAEGSKEGKEDGLSAVDTKADIGASIKQTGKLEVLVASVALINVNSVGEEYKGLYVMKGDAIFTIDLSSATVGFSEDAEEVFVNIPAPDVVIYINDKETERLDSYQKTTFSGTNQDGYTEYVNSMKQIDDNVKKSIVNFDSLVETANDVGKKRVEALIDSICGGGKIIHVTVE